MTQIMKPEGGLSPRLVAALYVGLAVMALPFVVFGLGFHVSGFDCTDASWADSIPLADRDVIYRALGGRVRIGLLLVGLAGLVPMAMLLLSDKTALGRARVALVTLIVGVWLLYGLAFWFSLWWFRCIDGSFTG